jgi:ribosomal protein S12 methylthiotransferase accessory factor
MNYVSSPRFAVNINGATMLLCHETGSWVFQTPAHVAIALELLQSPVSETRFNQLAGLHGEQAIVEVLRDFGRIGFLRRVPAQDYPRPTLAWWESAGAEPEARHVSLETADGNGLDLLTAALASHGIGIGPAAPLKIVLTDDYLRPEAESALAGDTPCLLAKMVGHTIWIGPHLRPGRPVCYSCLAWWLRLHRWEHLMLSSGTHGEHPQQASLAFTTATLMTAAGMIATAAAVILAGERHPELENAVMLFDTRDGTTSRKAVRPGAFCAACAGTPPSQPEEGLQRFFTPTGGMVHALHHRDYRGRHHAAAEFVYPLPRTPGRTILRSEWSYGSGISAGQAAENAIAEAVERYSSAWRGDEETVPATADEPGCIHPERLLLFSDAQYCHRDALNYAANELFWVPERLPAGKPIQWVRATALDGSGSVKVPAGIVYFGWRFEDEPAYAVPDSMGCAAGHTLEEAIANAAFELIERDAVAIWWYNRAARPRVRLEAFGGGAAADAARSLRESGREPYLIDITTDLGIPVYLSVAPRTEGSQPWFAAAAHTDPSVAAAKALKELSQICAWNEVLPVPQAFEHWVDNTNVNTAAGAWLRGSHEAEPPPPAGLSAREQIGHCQRRLAQAGIDSYWVDLTRREVNVPVARVLAPGLRHPWARFAPGRLYQVPVRLGWREQALREEELNPDFCFL